MIDLHCHILPCVDDGACNTDEALDLLRMEAEQGVEAVCLTPHLRSHMFTTSDQQIWEAFQRFQSVAVKCRIPIHLCLGREYYYDSNFLELMKAETVFFFGSKRVVLVEFSYQVELCILKQAAIDILAANYTPMFAHIERYENIQKNPDFISELIALGVIIQVNADDILGDNGWKIKHLCHYLIKNNLIHVVASDAHDMVHRFPRMDRCYNYLHKKYGASVAKQLMNDTPLSILSNEK